MFVFVGVIKVFDKKGPHACKFSMKYKDDPNWWTHSDDDDLLFVLAETTSIFCVRVQWYGKDHDKSNDEALSMRI